MHNLLILSPIVLLNLITFIVYGIDKLKARKNKWRIPDSTLMLLAIIGGSIGALLGIKVWHHKTLHRKFRYGIPMIILAETALVIYFTVNI